MDVWPNIRYRVGYQIQHFFLHLRFKFCFVKAGNPVSSGQFDNRRFIPIHTYILRVSSQMGLSVSLMVFVLHLLFSFVSGVSFNFTYGSLEYKKNKYKKKKLLGNKTKQEQIFKIKFRVKKL